MARLARVVVPGLPHHVTQRGNRRERTFFEDGDSLSIRGWCQGDGYRVGFGEVEGTIMSAKG